MQFVPAARTRLSPEEAGAALYEAFGEEFGVLPSADCLAILMAQTALETGNWQQMYNFNWGNIKASKGWPWYTMFRCNELINGKLEWFDPPHPQTRFRAYKDAVVGAQQYLRFLGKDTTGNGKNRYQKAWEAAVLGDSDLFVTELKAAGYFTASLNLYLKGQRALVAQYKPLAESITLSDDDFPEENECSRFSDEDLKEALEHLSHVKELLSR